MTVSQIPYKRVSLEDVATEAAAILAAVKNATSAEQVLEARNRHVAMVKSYYTATALSYMRYSINTVDEFYLGEKDYYDEIGPEVQRISLDYAKAMLETPFRKELEESGAIIPLVFESYLVETKAMSPEIVQDMIEENKVVSEYSRLMASMEFPFRGEMLPRPMLMKYAKSQDRATRKEAYVALGETLQKHGQQLDDIFDRLVRSRNGMSQKTAHGVRRC